MTAKTPVYQLEYIVQGEPIRNTRLALENNAKSIEAALIARGVAAANAPDVLAVSGRVSKLEAPGCVVYVPNTMVLTSTAAVPQLVTWTYAAGSTAGLIGTGSPVVGTRLVPVNGAGAYDIKARAWFPPNASGTRGIAYRISGGAWQYLDHRPAVAEAGYGTNMTASDPGVVLTATDYVEFGVWQSSGVTLTLSANSLRASLARKF